MPNWFYNDAAGTKQGPINDAQLRALCQSGIITPQTDLETEGGHRGKAGQVRGLFSASAPPSYPTPPSTPVHGGPSFYCSNCGYPVGEQAVACMNCGATPVIITQKTDLGTEGGPRGKVGQPPVMVYCTNCGNPVEEQDVACMKCGASPVDHRKFCRWCGVALNPEQVICTKCGASVESISNNPQSISSSSTVYCTNCGNPVKEQAYACMKCGASPIGHNKFCRCCGVALNPEQIVCIKCGAGIALTQNRPRGYAAREATSPGYGATGYDGSGAGEPKSKITAGILALLLGGIGVHKFYMGSWGWGIVFVAAILLTGGFGGIATSICGLVEGLIYLTMSQEEFEEKYSPQTAAPFRW